MINEAITWKLEELREYSYDAGLFQYNLGGWADAYLGEAVQGREYESDHKTHPRTLADTYGYISELFERELIFYPLKEA